MSNIFRPAVPADIKEGQVVFIHSDEGEMVRMTIEEVLRPSDQWKGFVASDGCRYGLEGCYIGTLETEDALLKDKILGVAQSCGLDFLIYDRKNDEELPLDMLHKAIRDGVLSVDEIAASFKKSIEDNL